MSKLLNCPFCGGEVAISNEQIDATREVYNFHCRNCDMVTFYDFPNDKEEAIKHWNARKPMANIVEKLEEKQHQANKDMQISESYEDVQAYGGKYLAFTEAINIVKQEINKEN